MRNWKLGCISMLIFLAIGLLILGLVGGSYRTNIVIDFNHDTDKVDEITFKEEIRVNHFLYGLTKGDTIELEDYLSKNSLSWEEISQLKIITKYSWLNALITMVTLGIYCPNTVLLEGTVR
ncbi:MAG: hypothetical protein WC549_01285 [Actinomycetota bacterium]